MSHVGRKPQGTKLVTELEGSAHAKSRMTLFLETMAGHKKVEEACQELGIHKSRFFVQRDEWLQGALKLLEPRSPGRPPKATPVGDEAGTLRRQVREAEARGIAAVVQDQLRQVLPPVVHPPESVGGELPIEGATVAAVPEKGGPAGRPT